MVKLKESNLIGLVRLVQGPTDSYAMPHLRRMLCHIILTFHLQPAPVLLALENFEPFHYPSGQGGYTPML